jgi:histidine triad (HIT) family protein
MKDEKCLFCKIAAKEEPAVIVWENTEFVCVESKYPVAPIHVLVIPKSHEAKKAWTEALNMGVTLSEFWGKMMLSVFTVVTELGLDKTGYKLVNNGAGYNHFEHEHMHILGGTAKEPGGTT